MLSISFLKNHMSIAARSKAMLFALRRHLSCNENAVIMIATPSHGNLGDQAIVYAQRRFLRDTLPGYGIFEIQRYQYEYAKKEINRLLRPTDLIVIDGGGNVGSLWPEENAKMNDIVYRFRENPVVVFPQTAFFEDNEKGREQESAVAQAYSSNSHLVFFSRDLATYDKIAAISSETSNYYVPDIVPYITDAGQSFCRSGALMCMRDDKERIMSGKSEKAIESFLLSQGMSVRKTSTVVSNPSRIFEGNRDQVLRSKWGEFSSAEVVVTDRLHGMLFSAITGTPCVAFDNVSHKVLQSYDWIKETPNIKIVSELENFSDLLNEVLLSGPIAYSRSNLDAVYDDMKVVVRNAVK